METTKTQRCPTYEPTNIHTAVLGTCLPLVGRLVRHAHSSNCEKEVDLPAGSGACNRVTVQNCDVVMKKGLFRRARMMKK
jgi:hypothetical protein